MKTPLNEEEFRIAAQLATPLSREAWLADTLGCLTVISCSPSSWTSEQVMATVQQLALNMPKEYALIGALSAMQVVGEVGD